MLRPYGLTPTGFTVLTLLEAKEAVRQIDLATQLLLDTSTMTRLIDRLERAGYVARMSNPRDRRTTRVMITPDGRSQLHAANLHVETLIAQRLSVLTEAEQQQLLGLLEKLRTGLRADIHGVSDYPGDTPDEIRGGHPNRR